MRRMSFALTTDQSRRRRKIVTRRFGWWFLRPGDRVAMVEKGMGFRKGERAPGPFDVMEVVSARPERVDAVDADDVRREGFPGRSPEWFVEMLCDHSGRQPSDDVNRIALVYMSELDECDRALAAGGVAHCGWRPGADRPHRDDHFAWADARLREGAA